MTGLSIKRNMLWNSLGSLIYLVCQWLVTVLVVRLSTGYDAAGMLALAMAISNIFAPIALYKIRSYQVSDVHKDVSAGEYVSFRFITIAVGAFIAIAYMVATCDPSTYLTIVLYLIFRAGDIFIDVLHGIDQQNFRMDYCGKSMAVRGILFLIAFSIVFLVTGDLNLAVFAMIIATYPVIVYDVICARKFDVLMSAISFRKMKELALTCLPAVIGLVSCYAVTTVARQLLGNMSGEAALGIYASVCTPVLIIQAGASYIYAPLLGIFASHFDEGKLIDFNRLLRKVSFSIAIIFLVGAVGFFFFGNQFLEIVFGADIVPYAYLLFPALLCTGLTAYVAFLSDLLISVREMKGNLIGNVASLVVAVPFSVLSISLWNMNGVSYAIALSYAIASAIMLWYLGRRINHVILRRNGE